MDFTKYVALLRYGQLHFARADSFDDQWEGLAIKEFSGPVRSGNEGPTVGSTYQLNADLDTPERRQISVSCWCQSEHESVALWGQYLSSVEGLAVLTTVQDLHAQLDDGPIEIQCGPVQYVDLQALREPLVTVPDRFFVKDVSFSHEREYRALIYDSGDDASSSGTSVGVDPGDLLREVIVHPNAPLWFAKLVHDTTEEKVGDRVPVRPSTLGKHFGYTELHFGEAVHVEDRSRVGTKEEDSA